MFVSDEARNFLRAYDESRIFEDFKRSVRYSQRLLFGIFVSCSQKDVPPADDQKSITSLHTTREQFKFSLQQRASIHSIKSSVHA